MQQFRHSNNYFKLRLAIQRPSPHQNDSNVKTHICTYEVQSSNCQWLKLNFEYLWKNWSLLFVLALQFSLISPFFFIYSLFWPLKVCRKSKAQNKVRKLSPWPRKLPLTGNLHNFIGSPPHYALRQLAGEHGPLMHLQLGEIFAIMLLSLSPRNYSTLAAGQNGLLSFSGKLISLLPFFPN